MRKKVRAGCVLICLGWLMLQAALSAQPRAEQVPPAQQDSGGKSDGPGRETGPALAPKPAESAEEPAAQSVGTAKQPAPKQEKVAEAPKPAKPTLSPPMATLRDHVRRVLAYYFRQPVNTSDNTPADILHFCLAFGCDTEVRYGGSAGNAMSGIGCLCYNYPCAGYRLLVLSDPKVCARIGYALQESPGQLLAVLAQSAVPESYEIRVGDWRGTVSDLAESEKLSCVSGIDLSQKLIGLAHYLPDGAAWKNAAGEAWSLERMVREELDRSVPPDGPEATDHLMGLTEALARHARTQGAPGRPMTGQYERTQKYLDRYQHYALTLQNTDGTWHAGFFAAKGPSRDTSGVLRATGHILEWLVASLPPDRLQDRRLVASVAYVTARLEGPYAQISLTAASPQEVATLMHALHALKLYDRKVFETADPDKPEPPKTAAKEIESPGPGGP